MHIPPNVYIISALGFHEHRKYEMKMNEKKKKRKEKKMRTMRHQNPVNYQHYTSAVGIHLPQRVSS